MANLLKEGFGFTKESLGLSGDGLSGSKKGVIWLRAFGTGLSEAILKGKTEEEIRRAGYNAGYKAGNFISETVASIKEDDNPPTKSKLNLFMP